MEILVSVLIFVTLLHIVVTYNLIKSNISLNSKVRYLELLIDEVNKSIPTNEKLERLIAKLFVRSGSRTVEGKLEDL